MNILYISLTYPTPVRPGQIAFNFHMVKSLRSRHDVRVIAPVPFKYKTPLDVDRLVVVSEDLAGTAIELGTPPDRVEVVYRGVDRNDFRKRDRRLARRHGCLQPDDVVLLWCGRLEPVKNPLLLINVAAKLMGQMGDRLKILVVGDGSRWLAVAVDAWSSWRSWAAARSSTFSSNFRLVV